jgi:hypothetical protein
VPRYAQRPARSPPRQRVPRPATMTRLRRNLSVKVFQVAGAKASWGPSGWLLSRIATAGPNDPTSTQVPRCRRCSCWCATRCRSRPSFFGHFPDQVAGRDPRLGLCPESIETKSDMIYHRGAVGDHSLGCRLQVGHGGLAVEIGDHEVRQQARVSAGKRARDGYQWASGPIPFPTVALPRQAVKHKSGKGRGQQGVRALVHEIRELGGDVGPFGTQITAGGGEGGQLGRWGRPRGGPGRRW